MEAIDAREALGRNLTWGLCDALGKSIVTGVYTGRAFPTEAELAKQHNVSRAVTREAVKMLTAKGLLSARPRQGTMIQPESHWNLFDSDVLGWLVERKFSLVLMRQFCELRKAIEPAAAELAARAATAEGLALIRACYQRLEAAERGDDYLPDADIAFHVSILQASGNPFFARCQELVRPALLTSDKFMVRLQGRPVDLPGHKAVLDCIEAGDSAGARSAAEFLIQQVLMMVHRVEAQETGGQRS